MTPSPLALQPLAVLRELGAAQQKILRGAERIARFSEDELAIATAPKEEIWREDMVRLYRYLPDTQAKAPAGPPIVVLIAYALVGRYQMIDLEAERSFVRKLLARGLHVYMVDWGEPKRQHRWVTIGDYVNGYLDSCVDVVRERENVDSINLIGVCQGGVLSLCHAALHPEKVRNLVLTVTPLDFHGDKTSPEAASGYMNRWARSLQGEDIDALVDSTGNASGRSVGHSFVMMSPVGNLAKYTVDLVDVLDDDRKLLGFLRVERWIGDRPDTPGEFVRQWFKDLYQDNKLIRNAFVLDGRTVDLRNVTMPVLNVSADGDVVVPTACSRGVGKHFGSSDYAEMTVPGGHIGTFVGGKAQGVLAPGIADWLAARNRSTQRTR
jgi:polyhydroxyalkanoate synthase subunit PhaC